MCVIGFDTSNYTTSVAAVLQDGRYINLKRILEVKKDCVGVRQSDAVFMHVKNLPVLVEEINKELLTILDGGYNVVAVGVSTRPRSVENSYMPCFLSGVSVASSISSILRVPCYEFSHQDGHIRAALFSAGSDVLKEFYSFHLSGGTCELLKTKASNNGFYSQIVSTSADITLGQLVDRVGVMMGLQFPAGAHLEQLALASHKEYKIKVSGREAVNISGFENQARKMLEEGSSKESVAYYIYSVITAVIERMLKCRDDVSLPVLFAGGVSGSKIVKESVKDFCTPLFSEPELSSDNAVGIALLTKEKFEKGI